MALARAWPNHAAWMGAIISLRESSPLPLQLIGIFSSVSKAPYTFWVGVKNKSTCEVSRGQPLNLLRRLLGRHHIAVGKGLQEGHEGIFLLVRQFKVAELPLIEVG
jgi:hypothetical protein